MRSALVFIILVAIVAFVGWERGWYVPHAPVVEAAEEGDLDKVKALIKQGRSINEHESKVKFGWTPLIAAIYQDNTNVVRYLIESGADLNLGDKNGETPLMWAMARGDEHVEVVKDLIAHGVDVLATNANGATALSYASSDPPKPKILEVVKAAIAEQEKKKTNQ
jgi:ankyrin repeat protein